jgi:L-amino acid N-acyltransferase YncA
MTATLIWTKHHCQFVWRIIEVCNVFLLGLCFGRKLKNVQGSYNRQEAAIGYFRALGESDAEEVFELLQRVTEEEKVFFNPHDFDITKINKILRSRGYMTFGFFSQEKLAGYFFLRLFFVKKAFIGRYVERSFRGKGVGKEISRFLCDLGKDLGFKVYSTISKDNLASLGSHRSTVCMEVVKELPNNYVLVKIT